MAKALRIQNRTRYVYGLPPESERERILFDLLKTRHFPGGIWYNGRTIGVRTVITGEPQHLSWNEARKIVATYRQSPERKQTAANGNGRG